MAKTDHPSAKAPRTYSARTNETGEPVRPGRRTAPPGTDPVLLDETTAWAVTTSLEWSP